MTIARLRAAAIMAAHTIEADTDDGLWCPSCQLWLSGPCLPYRLAAELAAAQERISALEATIESVFYGTGEERAAARTALAGEGA